MNEYVLLWVSFVGFIMFLVRGIYSVILLKLQKSKDISQADFNITIITAIFAVLFAVITLTNNQKNKTQPNNTYDRKFEKFGDFIIYDNSSYKSDTVTLFIEVK